MYIQFLFSSAYFFYFMNWIPLQSETQLEEILTASQQQTQVIFKHSTRCSISDMAKQRFERQWQHKGEEAATLYYLDLLAFREVSNAVAARLQIAHQSPQVIVIKNGVAVYQASHNAISAQTVAAWV